MKILLLKVIGIIFGVLAALVLVSFVVYVILYYPREAEPFEINTADPTKTLLIVTQGSDFKDTLVRTLCDSLKTSSVYIRGMDVKGLSEVDDDGWDRILIINSFIVRLNKSVERFVNRAGSPDKVLLFVTSGGADWRPKPELRVDALTSASRKVNIEDLIHMMTDWINNEDDQEWEPDDYLLALRYFPRVDVDVACETIESERERYGVLYPNLVDLINRVGYQYLRWKDVNSAIEVFRLNVSLFPDNWNVYDSYGEALLTKGDREAAIRSYRKALELNPDSKSAKGVLEEVG